MMRSKPVTVKTYRAIRMASSVFTDFRQWIGTAIAMSAVALLAPKAENAVQISRLSEVPRLTCARSLDPEHGRGATIRRLAMPWVTINAGLTAPAGDEEMYRVPATTLAKRNPHAGSPRHFTTCYLQLRALAAAFSNSWPFENMNACGQRVSRHAARSGTSIITPPTCPSHCGDCGRDSLKVYKTECASCMFWQFPGLGESNRLLPKAIRRVPAKIETM